jgi:phosphoribosylformylglycinamidine synthase I
MSRARIAVLYAPGTNCHEETVAAIACAGGQSSVVLIHDLFTGCEELLDYQAAVIPGGFSYGDHLGAGRVFAAMLNARIGDELQAFLSSQRPLLGICNGYQVLTEAGVLPARTPGVRRMALVENQSAHFENRTVRLVVEDSDSLWTRGLKGEMLQMPSAHGEGRPLLSAQTDSKALRIAFMYAGQDGIPTENYPENPSGAPHGAAGVLDQTGFILGLMPHPERAALPTHTWRDGLKLFHNLARYLG